MAAEKWNFSLYDESEMTVFFEFLDQMKDGGSAVNRLYVGEFLKDKFGLGLNKAQDIFAAWDRTYDKEIPAARRASVCWRTYGGG